MKSPQNWVTIFVAEGGVWATSGPNVHTFETHDWLDHLQALRDLLERPLLVILLDHTNQRGQISGAWDLVPDTLMFVVNTGKGTRLVWQKARDSSTLHAASWKLKWGPRDGVRRGPH
jgi:hypothetical protein